MGSKILLIDDDVEILKVLQSLLNVSGFETSIASNLPEAANIIAENRFDLVVSDIVMSDDNGLEFFKDLARKNVSLPPFLFCSGLPMFSLEPPYPEGIAGFLSKPFSVPDLINTMKNVIH